MGDISLRRRLEPSLLVDVYEVGLGDEYLMSSLFTVAEVALADLTLAAVTGDDLDVVVGGLGLGYTAHAALRDPRVGSLRVIEALPAVIGWHRDGLLPLGRALTDERCELVEADFFATTLPDGLDAICLDIDHTPRNHLHPSHAALYRPDGLGRLAATLRPGGAFGLWSDDPPDDEFTAALDAAFAAATAHVVPFANPVTGGTAANTVYVATT